MECLMRVRRFSRRAAFAVAGALILLASAPASVHAEAVVSYTYDANGNLIAATVASDTTPPSAPGTPTFSNITMTSATATWTAATDNVGVTGYDYRLNSGAWQSLGDVLSVNLTGLSVATNYVFDVRARDAATNLGAASSGAFATSADTAPPSTPTGLAASAPTPTRVDLSWTASTDNVGVTGYKIFRNGGQINTSSTTSYSDTPVASGTTYSYTVSAYDSAQNSSGQSNVANVTTPVPPLQATVSSTTWNWFQQQGQPAQVDPDVVVTASGGTGGYTFQWQWVSGDTQTTVVSPTSNSTKWSRTVPNFFVDYTSVWRCRVTDSSGTPIYAPNVTVNFRKENFSAPAP